MRSGGINWLAVIVSAIIIYAIGFAIYGLVVPEDQLMAMMNLSDAEMATAMSRMPFSIVMPVMTAVFMAILFKWGAVSGVASGVKWAVLVGLASAVPTMLYGWVYGGLPTNMTLIDISHLLLGHIAAGAVLGGWK